VRYRTKFISEAEGLEVLVELAGIEPATSSLRILNPVRDDATPKKPK